MFSSLRRSLPERQGLNRVSIVMQYCSLLPESFRGMEPPMKLGISPSCSGTSLTWWDITWGCSFLNAANLKDFLCIMLIVCSLISRSSFLLFAVVISSSSSDSSSSSLSVSTDTCRLVAGCDCVLASSSDSSSSSAAASLPPF